MSWQTVTFRDVLGKETFPLLNMPKVVIITNEVSEKSKIHGFFFYNISITTVGVTITSHYYMNLEPEKKTNL